MQLARLKPYLDLTRLHFFFVWPLVFCSGLFLSFVNYGGFSVWLVVKAILIAFFGFEAGFVLNDYVDRDLDTLDVDSLLSRYWRPFGTRPLPSEALTVDHVRLTFLLLAGAATALILSLPYPHSLYVFGIMLYSYGVEWFYQVKKRSQRAPIAQLLGRTDFSLFPVAGYLVNGQPDHLILSYLLFFYPYTQVHLGLNDIIDTVNDRARGLATVPVLFGERGTKLWMSGFTLIHLLFLALFLGKVGAVYRVGFMLGALALLTSNVLVWRGNTPAQWIKALPVFHSSLLFYTLSMILPHLL